MRNPRAVMHLLFVASVFSGYGGELRFGVKGGVPLTSYFETGRYGTRNGSAEYSAATRRYTVGMSAEWRHTENAGLELDVLYKRMGYVGRVTSFGSGILTTSSFDAKGNSWDIALLAKRRFGRSVRPSVAGGGVLRYVRPIRARGERTEQNLILGTTEREPIDTGEPTDLRKRAFPGFAAAGGIEFSLGRVRFLPEFRYTRWTANIANQGGVLRFNPNQSEFLLGLLF